MYVNGDLEIKKLLICRWMEKVNEDRNVVVGEDFNIRTGKEGR